MTQLRPQTQLASKRRASSAYGVTNAPEVTRGLMSCALQPGASSPIFEKGILSAVHLCLCSVGWIGMCNTCIKHRCSLIKTAKENSCALKLDIVDDNLW